MLKNLRAVEQEVFSFKNKFDVHSREYRTKLQIFFDILIGVALVSVGTALLVYYETLLGAGISFFAGVILLIYVLRAEKRKIVAERSEFLNALLASALASKHKFCMVVTQKDGQIVYLNNGFQKTFPKMVPLEKRMLSKLLKAYDVAPAKAKAIQAAVKKATDKEVAVEITSGKVKEKITFKIEAIARPSGFVLVRGV
jgi:hypothetical protein